MSTTDNFKPSSLLSNNQKSFWGSETERLNTIIKSQATTRSIDHHHQQQQQQQQQPSNVIRNAWNTDEDYDRSEDRETQHRLRNAVSFHRCSCCCRGFLLGCLVASLVLAIIIALWLIKDQTTTSLKNTVGSTITTSTTISLTSATTTSSSTSTTTSSTTSKTTSSTTSTTTSSATSTTTSSTTSTTTATPTCADWLWDPNGETVAGVTGTAGTAADKLFEPWNIYVEQTNNTLYIADSKNHRVQKWLSGATNGTTIAGTSGMSGKTSSLLDTPRDVFVDASGNIYVADSGNQRIQFFPQGNITGSTASTSWTSVGSMWGVQVVKESVYACDNDKEIVWNNGTAVASNQWNNNAGYPILKPQGFAVDTSIAVGTVYIVNSDRHVIVKWPVGANNGTTVAGIYNSNGSLATLLKFPTAIKLDNYTNMFVADNNNHRIQLFCQYPVANTTGRTIAGTGSPGQSNNTLTYPAGLALDASLNLYVADTQNHRIQKFRRIL